MKRIFFLVTMALSVTLVQAQKYEDVKNKLILGQYKAAKEDVDKGMSNPKFNGKAEAYLLKAAVYAALALDNENKNTPAGEKLAEDAAAAFMKYKEMEPEMSLIADPIYQNAPVNIYTGYYSNGYTDYTAKKWPAAAEKFKKAVDYSDILIAKKVLNAAIDTNVLILAGITAENANLPDQAAIFYKRLADNKINGDGFESIYRFMVNHSFNKKDIASFEKYKALGAELFPKSEYFTYDKVDFAVGLVTGFDEKMKALEEVLTSDPGNYKANQILGEIIYDTLNPRDEKAPLPSNAELLEKRMIDAFNKAAAAKPNTENAYIYMGDHYVNKAVKVNEAREAHANDMKSRTKPGQMASKEDVAKRDQLDKQYGETLVQAQEPYEKAANLFAARSNLDNRDKQQYKKVVGYLTDIFAYKKKMAKGKPAEIAKYEAEEKKWNDRYESIK